MATVTRILNKKGITSLMVMAILLSVYFAVKPMGGPWQAVVNTSRDVGFILSDLTISGANRTKESDVYRALDIDDGVPLLSIDLVRIKAELEQLGWIKSVELTRSLPNGLKIEITERTPFAFWQHKGDISLVDPEGVVITKQSLKEFEGLMLLVGKGANSEAHSLASLLDTSPELAQKVKSAIWVGGRRWDLVFEGGIKVKLPEFNADYGASEAFQKFTKLEQEHRLLSREISVIDVRVKDRVFLRVTENGQQIMSEDRWNT